MPPQPPREPTPEGTDEDWKPVTLAEGAMPAAWCKEDLSVAYAQATGTAIGVTCDRLQRDINGWDVHYRARDTDTADAQQLAAQLKCTVNRLQRVDGGRSVSFTLEVADYDNLRKVPTYPPRLLVVVEVPHHSPTRWVEVRPESLLLRACAWWASLAGEPALAVGQESKTVRIPVDQRFTPSALSANMCSCP